jgi:hypothetical protein
MAADDQRADVDNDGYSEGRSCDLHFAFGACCIDRCDGKACGGSLQKRGCIRSVRDTGQQSVRPTLTNLFGHLLDGLRVRFERRSEPLKHLLGSAGEDVDGGVLV